MIISQQLYRLVLFRIDQKSKKMVIDFYQYVWSIAIILGIISEFAYCGYLAFDGVNIFPNKQKFFSWIIYMELSMTIACALFYICSATFKAKKQITFYEQIFRIDEIMQRKFKAISNYKRYQIIAVVFLIVVLLYYQVFVTVIVWFFGRFILRHEFTLNGCIILVIYTGLATASGIFTHGYVGCVMLIYQKISRLSYKLRETLQRENEKVCDLY
jgi:7tm Chemosensory receptor